MKTLTIILRSEIGVAHGTNTVDDNEDQGAAGRLALESKETSQYDAREQATDAISDSTPLSFASSSALSHGQTGNRYTRCKFLADYHG